MMRTLLSPTDQQCNMSCVPNSSFYIHVQSIQYITLIIHFLFEMNIFERLTVESCSDFKHQSYLINVQLSPIESWLDLDRI